MFKFLLGLPKLFQGLGALLALLVILSPFILKKCEKLKDAKKIKTKQVEQYKKDTKAAEDKAEVHNDTRKDEIESVKEVEDKATDKPPTDEELKGVREKIIKKFKQGLPKK